MCFLIFNSYMIEYIHFLDIFFENLFILHDWKPVIVFNTKKYIVKNIKNSLNSHLFNCKKITVEQEKYIVYNVLYYIYEKTLFLGNTQFTIYDLPIDIELKHCHFPVIDDVVISKFIDSIFKMNNNNNNNLYEDAYLNHKFNMLLYSIIETIDFTTIICEINHNYISKKRKNKHLRKVIIGEELCV